MKLFPLAIALSAALMAAPALGDITDEEVATIVARVALITAANSSDTLQQRLQLASSLPSIDPVLGADVANAKAINSSATVEGHIAGQGMIKDAYGISVHPKAAEIVAESYAPRELDLTQPGIDEKNSALLAAGTAQYQAEAQVRKKLGEFPVNEPEKRRVNTILSIAAIALSLVLLMLWASNRKYGSSKLVITSLETAGGSSPEIKVGWNETPSTGVVKALLSSILGVSVFVAYLAYGITLLVAGYHGIEEGLGTFLAVLAIAVAIIFQFTLPITIGAYFGTMEAWGWDWYWSLLFVAPGLAFLIPGLVVAATAWVIERPNARQTR